MISRPSSSCPFACCIDFPTHVVQARGPLLPRSMAPWLHGSVTTQLWSGRGSCSDAAGWVAWHGMGCSPSRQPAPNPPHRGRHPPPTHALPYRAAKSCPPRPGPRSPVSAGLINASETPAAQSVAPSAPPFSRASAPSPGTSRRPRLHPGPAAGSADGGRKKKRVREGL